MARRFGLALLAFVIASSATAFESPGAFEWHLPTGFPMPVVPANNGMSASKVELGRYLFYDRRLSVNGEGSCATCHIQHYGFTDQKPVAIGVTGESHPRRVMPLANVAWFAAFNWANPNVTQLEEQSMTPMFNAHPLELGLDQANDKFLKTLATEPVYQRLFPQAFAGHSGAFTFVEVRQALAAFERTLISGNSPYDRYRYRHEADAIGDSAKRGEDLFFHQPYSCSRCHGGFTFGGETVFQTSDGSARNGQAGSVRDVEFVSNGLYNLPVTAKTPHSYPEDNLGLYEITHDLADVGKFRAPSLRNVAVRAPYMHDGSMRSLDAVLDHYARGGQHNANQSPTVAGFPLSAQQRADLKAFLESLTDEQFLHDPALANPWPQSTPLTPAR